MTPPKPALEQFGVVGCIPMIPGSLAAKGLMNLFELLRTTPGEGLLSTTAAVENLMLVAYPRQNRHAPGNSDPGVSGQAKR